MRSAARPRALRAALLACCVASWSAGCAALPPAGDMSPGLSSAGPAGAVLRAEGGSACATPCRLDLAALPEAFDLRIEVDGFAPASVVVRRLGDTWQAGVVALGGSPCLAIDTVRGEVLGLSVEQVESGRASAAIMGMPQPGRLYAVTVTESDASWASVLRLSRP